PHFVHRLAGMLQNVKLVVHDPALRHSTVPGFAETVPTCPHTLLESHFVEMHSAASRKTRPASLSYAPVRTTAVLPSPGSSLPSETSGSSQIDLIHSHLPQCWSP